MLILGPRPNPCNLRLLKEQALAEWESAMDVNEVGADIGFYFTDGSPVSQDDVNALVAAHDGTQMSQGEMDEQAMEQNVADAQAALLDMDEGKASKSALQRAVATLIRKVLGGG